MADPKTDDDVYEWVLAQGGTKEFAERVQANFRLEKKLRELPKAIQ